VQDAKEERTLGLVLAAYIVVFGLKPTVYFMSGVMALLAEALHTLSDIFISGFLLVAARYSRRRADEVYMFGYGRAHNVAALVAATLFISFTSFELYREAIPRLVQPGTARAPSMPDDRPVATRQAAAWSRIGAGIGTSPASARSIQPAVAAASIDSGNGVLSPAAAAGTITSATPSCSHSICWALRALATGSPSVPRMRSAASLLAAKNARIRSK
jgi:cation diffusion facilitator family transporter